MLLKTAIISSLLYNVLCFAQTPEARPTNLAAVQSSTATAAPAARPDDVAALRDDIRKMRNLVQQMETNLSFVSDTQSPLKHQFDMEIQMWKILIEQMERRLDAIERH